MDINLSTVNGLFAGSVCANSAPSRPEPIENSRQFALPPDETGPQVNKAEAAGTDNIPPEAPESPVENEPNEFRNALREQSGEETEPHEFRNALQEGTPTDKEPSELHNAFREGTTVDEPTQEFRNALREGADPPAAQQIQNYLAFRAKVLNADVAPAVNQVQLKAGQESTNQIGEPVTANAQQVQAMVTLASQGENKALQSANGESQAKPETTPAESGDTGTKHQAVQNAYQTAGTTAGVAKAITTQENGGEAVVSGDGKNAAVGQEQITAEALAFAHSQKTAAMNGQRLAPLRQTKAATDGEKPTQTGPSDAGSGQKMTVRLNEAGAVQEKINNMGEESPFGPAKNAFTFQKSVQGDASNPQQTQATISQEAARWAPDKKASKPHAERSSAQTENTSGVVASQKLNAAHIQTSSNQNQAKGREGSTSNKNTSDSNFQHVLSHSDVQNVVLEQSGASSQAAKGPANPESGNVYSGVGEQIRESIHSLAGQGDQQITIRLNPPELGYVSIKLVEQGDEITGLLEVSRNQTRYEIQQVLPEVIRNLADSGVQIKRLDVMLANESEQQNYKDQSLQDGWGGRHNFPEGGSLENKTANEHMENDYSYQDTTETHQMFVTDNSINMLV